MNFQHHSAFDLDNRMTIVLFAGMGGGCDGLEDAGFHVHVAINHDPVAVAVHKKRHPHTRHLQCDVFEADPREVTGGRGVRILHASPDCTHFSVAKGGKPVSKRRRSLAWVVCRWMGTVRPEVVTLENVREIQTWGPLVAKRDPKTGRVMKLDGTVAAKGERVPVQEQWLIPDPRHKGRIWRAWLKHVRGLGYNFEGRELVCADYGIWTIRKRFFGVAMADGSPVTWPERTHAPRKLARKLKLKPWRGVHEVLDWSRPVKSIFGRKKELAEATKRRTARGVIRYVVTAAKPFIVPITHTMGPNQARSVEDPLNTITTAKGGELMVAVPHVTKFRTGAVGSDIEEPLPTFTANSFEKRPGGAVPLGLVSASLSPFTMGVGGRAAQSDERRMDEPAGSSTTKEDRVLVAATVQAYYGGEQGLRRNGDVQEPLQTFVTEPRHAVVAASLQRQFGESVAADVEEPAPVFTPDGQGKTALVAAFLAQHNDGPRAGLSARDAEEPISALTTTGSQQGVVAASMLALRGTNRDGRDATDPLATVTANGVHAGVVAASMAEMRGRSPEGRDIAEPLAAQTGNGNAHLILAFLQHYFSNGKQSDDLSEPLGALTAKARHGLVTVRVGKQDFVITDIGMRMLEPEEGAAAHGFKPGSLPDTIEIDGKVRRLTKTEKYHLVGNSVPPRMVQLLAECNARRALVMEAAE
jgi:DNA (cytosine-5)-methyltransferase 1